MNKKTLQHFQVFAKPVGPACNLGCTYCYYLGKECLWPDTSITRMPVRILETYIKQHIDACPDPVIFFSWHGGEPTLAGLDYFRNIVTLQNKHLPPGRQIINGIQTNGTLLDEDWCRFLAEENFYMGISVDGPAELHDIYRCSKNGKPTHHLTLHGYKLLQEHGISPEILCVVHAENVRFPLEVYEYFRELGAAHITFIPLVERDADSPERISRRTVPSELYGAFLSTIFDAWTENDIGRINVQIFDETARTAFGQDHTLCIFKETCGRVPVVEHTGDFYACDHFVDEEHLQGNIMKTPFSQLLESPRQQAFGRTKKDTLPQFCRECEVKTMCNGGCPKNRFIKTPDGEYGLNYLCAGYKRFFNHCKPFVDQLATLWHQQHKPNS